MLLKTTKQENTKTLGNGAQGANKQILEMKFMNQVKTPMFKSDIGYYFKIPYMKHCHARRLKHADVGKIMEVKDSDYQFNKTLQIVQNQFRIISILSAQVDAELVQKAKSSTNSVSNIKCNYFLKHFQTKLDINYGCFLFHEPLIITLDEWIKQGNLSYPQKLELIKQILEIMSFLQQLKICHRCITSYSFVVCYQNHQMYDPEADFMETKKNFKFDKNKHRLKITGFYQQIIIENKTKKNSSYPSPIFQNLYTDPNLNDFQTPQYDSDLWSVILLFYEILTGKIPNLGKPDDIKKGLQSILPWQKDMFQYYFQGTKKVRISLKDLKMRFKNELLSLQSTCKILKAKSLEMQISSEFQSIREWKKKNAEARKRGYSYSQQQN